MVVIREKRQFQVGTIGVARASEGGRIVGKAISQAADQFADMFYREGLQRAEKVGTEAGQAAESERIMTINPQTGQPEAYAPPAPFGRVAAEAYQRVVERRFQQSMDDEMKAKSAELAARYENNPNSTALYETAMSDYIASMSENAEGQFRGYITDTGTSYLNLTRSNLAIGQIRRERTAARAAQAQAVEDANNNLRSIVSQYGLSAISEESFGESIIASSTATVEDGVASGLFDPDATGRNARNQRLSIALGALQYAANNTQDLETLAQLQHAIGTQNPNALPAGYDDLKEVLAGFSSDFEALVEIERVSDGLFSDRISYANAIREAEIARIERAERVSIFDMEQGTPGSAAVATSFGVNPAISAGAVVRRAMYRYNDATAQAREATFSGQTDLATAITANRDTVFNGYVTGLQLRAVQGLTSSETLTLENAVQERNPRLAPTLESARALSALLALEQTTEYNVIEDFLPDIGGFRDGAAKAIDAQVEAAAYAQFVDGTQRAVQDIGSQRGNDIEASIQSVISAINEIDGLDKNVAENAIKTSLFQGSRAYVSEFFENNPTEGQIEAASAFLAGSDITDGLTQNQVNLLSRARDLGTDSGREANVRTHFNTLGNSVNQLRRRAEAETEKRRTLQDILSGAGDATSSSQRQLIQEHVETVFAPQLQAAGYASLTQLALDPAAFNNPDAQPVLQAIMGLKVMPEGIYNALRGVANGSFVGGSPATLVSHWTNFRTYNYNGNMMANPATLAFTEAETATLDFLADAAPIIGTSSQEFSELYAARYQLLNDPNFEAKAETFFGMTPAEFVTTIDGYENLSASARRGMEAAAVSLYAFSDANRMNKAAVSDYLTRQIDRTYPDGDGIVLGPNMSRRTMAPLSFAAPGNEEVFMDYTIRKLISAGVTNPRLGIRPIGGPVGETLRAIGGTVAYADDRIGRGEYFLQPIGVPTQGITRYQVMQLLPVAEGTRRPAMETVSLEMDGDVVEVTRPIILSSRDPLFLSMVRADQNLSGLEINMIREEYSPDADFPLEYGGLE